MFAIIVGAAVMVAILLMCVVYTARPAFLYAAIGVVLLAAGLVIVERSILTPREEVRAEIYAIAAALEANDTDAVLAHVSPTVPKLRERGARALGEVIIEQVKIKPNLKVQLAAGDPPTKATATFNVVVIGSQRRSGVSHQRGAWFFTVDLVKEGGDWRVVDYRQQDPRRGS